MKIEYRAIGIVHSPYKDIEGMPIQPAGADGVTGSVEIFPNFTEGLTDLDGFSHIFLLYHFHKVAASKLTITPFLDKNPHGIFATRAPTRPNAIGLSVVRLQGIIDNILTIKDVDILDQTPLIDIKPHVPAFDHRPADRIGWLEQSQHQLTAARSDERFR